LPSYDKQGSRVEVIRPQVFSRRIEEVSMFINAAHLYLRIKMIGEERTTQIAIVCTERNSRSIKGQLAG